MGITLKCKKTGTSYDLGYLGFLCLREKVAELCSSEFGEHYKTLFFAPSVGEARTKFYRDFDKKTAEMLKNRIVNAKVVDFCLQSDCEGKIRYGACKEIYNHIKNYDNNFRYGYAAYSDAMTFSDFKNLILECYENKSDLIWR